MQQSSEENYCQILMNALNQATAVFARVNSDVISKNESLAAKYQADKK